MGGESKEIGAVSLMRGTAIAIRILITAKKEIRLMSLFFFIVLIASPK